MNRLMCIVTSIALAQWASAIEVTTTPGQLANRVEDHTVTTLTVTGEMDARDFNFIAEHLTSLTTLDLSGVKIAAYCDPDHPLTASVYNFEAGTLPHSMLMGMKLEQIVLPDSLVAIGHAALAGCDRLTQVVIPSGVTTIGDYAFSGSGLQSVTTPASVTAIGRGAFAHCMALASATITGGAIGDYAFLGDTQLQSLQLGALVTSIGTEALHGTGLTQLDASQVSGLHSIGDWAMANTPLTTVALPGQMLKMGQGAFFYSTRLSSIQLPAGLSAIPDYAFAGGSQIAGDTILGNNVSTIGDYAFYNWDKTSHFFLPASVTHLGTRAMAGMTGLEQIDVAALQVPALGDSVWAGVNQPLVNLSTADNATADLYAAAEQWQEFYILHDYLLGDVNGDGLVDVTDINLLVNKILGADPSPFIEKAADIDYNHKFDVSDINGVVNIVLGQIEHTIVKRVQARNSVNRPMTTDLVTIDPITVKPGQETMLEVRLANSQDYAAMQMDITLPTGVEMVGQSVTATSRSSRHTQLMRTSGNQSRVVSLSMQNATYVNNDEPIFKIRVKATDEVAPGATIDINHVLLVKSDSKTFVAPESSARVDNLTGIDNLTGNNDRAYAQGLTLCIESSTAAQVQVVSLNGVSQSWQVPAGLSRWEHLDAGVYVVRLNGNSYKVVLQ